MRQRAFCFSSERSSVLMSRPSDCTPSMREQANSQNKNTHRKSSSSLRDSTMMIASYFNIHSDSIMVTTRRLLLRLNSSRVTPSNVFRFLSTSLVRSGLGPAPGFDRSDLCIVVCASSPCLAFALSLSRSPPLTASHSRSLSLTHSLILPLAVSHCRHMTNFSPLIKIKALL